MGPNPGSNSGDQGDVILSLTNFMDQDSFIEIDAQRATSTFFTLISNSNIYNICYCNVSNSGEGGTHVTTLTILYAVTAALNGNVFSCIGAFRDNPLQSTMYFRSPDVVGPICRR